MSLKGYEILFIILPSFGEEKRKNIVEDIINNITKNKGTILDKQELGLTDFAMELKKQTQGYYYQVKFKIDPVNLEHFQSHLVLSENIFRYQIVTLKSILTKEELNKTLN